MSINHSSKPSADTRLMPGGRLLWICKEESDQLGHVAIVHGVGDTFGSSFARRFVAESIAPKSRTKD
jgi:hypothetical protein